jgi:hypothetical protein
MGGIDVQTKCQLENLKGEGHIGDLFLGRKIILNWILNKGGMCYE